MDSSVSNGFPSEVIAHNAKCKACISVETDLINDSNSYLFTGNITHDGGTHWNAYVDGTFTTPV